MFASLIIVFREVIEVGLIIGIVLAATRGVQGRSPWVAGGVGVGIILSGILALGAGALAESLSGSGQDYFNIGVLLLAVVMLGWHNVWMARHGKDMAKNLKAQGDDVAKGKASVLALAIVIGIATLREGSEVVLFLYGISISGQQTALQILMGGISGLALGAALSALMYFSLITIPARYLFGVTTAIITLLAAGMMAQAIALMHQAGLATVLQDTIWDTSGFLPDHSIAGKILNALIGYTDRPSQLQFLGYVATLGILYAAMRYLGRKPQAIQ
jgi:high-affinity iron transporter